ncbi:TPA: ERF family protein [Enterobacter cloacae]|uniref:ERF family protein n=1 Tax=Enterobacter bugandensis TaxID=881260 RepID=UPI0020760690|nr:ERF family protein [Enterobacter bugandensis]MCM7631279.1 ERF family protein [Enterobacter bugandensis]HBM7655355.1 ERF family protein [Enterobacter cloacae subsp. cloacae]HCE8675622.1 ERF family protein [Enterobacter cloacae]HCE9221390.1 ERF family protein [Enterobacter cloacae]
MTDKKVYAAISGVASALAEKGISKERKQGSQVNYAFRGIDDIYNALAPELVKNKLLILPRYTERTSVERTSKNGGALFYITVRGDFDFVSTEDGSIHTVTTYGEAMDSGDKATNKAMSIAYKYAAFQAFCIPTEETALDADAEVHQVAPQDAEAALREFGDKAQLAQSVEELQGAYKEVWPKLGGVKSYEERAAETYKTRGRELHKQAA